MFGQAAIARDLTARLHAELKAAVRAPDEDASLAKHGAAAITLTADRFTEFVKAEHAKRGRAARLAAVKLE